MLLFSFQSLSRSILFFPFTLRFHFFTICTSWLCLKLNCVISACHAAARTSYFKIYLRNICHHPHCTPTWPHHMSPLREEMDRGKKINKIHRVRWVILWDCAMGQYGSVSECLKDTTWQLDFSDVYMHVDYQNNAIYVWCKWAYLSDLTL